MNTYYSGYSGARATLVAPAFRVAIGVVSGMALGLLLVAASTIG